MTNFVAERTCQKASHNDWFELFLNVFNTFSVQIRNYMLFVFFRIYHPNDSSISKVKKKNHFENVNTIVIKNVKVTF